MYISDNYARVKAMIENKRRDAIALADARNLEVREKSPEIDAIDRELTKTGLILFRTAMAGGDIDAVRRSNQALCQKRREELKKLGLPEDYTEVRYECAACSDTGYVGTAMCSCLRSALIRENLRTSGMGELIERQSFNNFDLERYKKQSPEVYERMRANLLMAKKYAENFRRDRGNLLLIGPTGTGKTHLSTSIARCVIEQGFDVLYDTAQNVVSAFEYDRFHAGYGPTAQERGEKYLTCSLLILDDLGTEFSNAFTVSALYNLFNERQNKGLSTVISTNLSTQELTRVYEDRIYSRIIGKGSVILSFMGKDQRLS